MILFDYKGWTIYTYHKEAELIYCVGCPCGFAMYDPTYIVNYNFCLHKVDHAPAPITVTYHALNK